MALWLQISPISNEPIYSQIITQVARCIASGEIHTGDKLPAVRKLAQELVINPNTVARAYSLMEQQGLVTTKTGSGTYVADPKLRDTDAAQLNVLSERMDTIISQAMNMGLDARQIASLLATRLKRFGAANRRGRKK